MSLMHRSVPNFDDDGLKLWAVTSQGRTESVPTLEDVTPLGQAISIGQHALKHGRRAEIFPMYANH